MAGSRDRYHRLAEHERKADINRRAMQLELQDRIALGTIIDCALSPNARIVGSFARMVLAYVQKRDRREDYRRNVLALHEYDNAINAILARPTIAK